jgi:ribonuclease J
MIFVDGVDIGDPTDVALRDRRMLSADGIFVVVATISEQDGSSVAEPEVIFRGVPYPDDAVELLEEIREIDLLQQVLHDDLAEFVYERLRRRPMVLPVVVEV